MAEPVDSQALDADFAGQEREVCVGHIRGIPKLEGWQRSVDTIDGPEWRAPSPGASLTLAANAVVIPVEVVRVWRHNSESPEIDLAAIEIASDLNRRNADIWVGGVTYPGAWTLLFDLDELGARCAACNRIRVEPAAERPLANIPP